ncbi:MAG TPA: roadblock/LC7 domain-containing protein [bacterium (Candidatus Stahlbacteria)]|nr:roadblock/LC7 domain-containing protein [Candidatus Stahlbacteria bacterium]
MRDIDQIPGVKAYTIVKSEDGTLVEKSGETPFALEEIVAFIGSGGEVIRDALGLGDLNYMRLLYEGHPVFIIPRDDEYVGLLCEPTVTPEMIIGEEEVKEEVVELPKALSAKLKQINSIFVEFSAEGKKAYWRDLLKKGVDLLSHELASHIRVTDGGIEFTSIPPKDQVEECASALRTVIDFLVKKAVEEFGPSKARVKVQRVIESLR